MAGKCKICGYEAGIFNLTDGICKSCIKTNKINSITDINETNKSATLGAKNNPKEKYSAKNPIIYSKEYGEYYVWGSTYGIKNKKFFKSPEGAVEYIKSNPQKYIDIEDSNDSSPYSDWVSQAIEAKEKQEELASFEDAVDYDKYNEPEKIQNSSVNTSSKKFLWPVTIIFVILIILMIRHSYLNNKAESEYQEYILVTENPITLKGKKYFITRGSKGSRHLFDPENGTYIVGNFYLKIEDQILKISPSTITTVKGSFSWRLFECGIMCFL